MSYVWGKYPLPFNPLKIDSSCLFYKKQLRLAISSTYQSYNQHLKIYLIPFLAIKTITKYFLKKNLTYVLHFLSNAKWLASRLLSQCRVWTCQPDWQIPAVPLRAQHPWVIQQLLTFSSTQKSDITWKEKKDSPFQSGWQTSIGNLPSLC